MELYDLKQDVGEHHNVARQNEAKVREYRRLLEDWRRDVNAVMPKPNPKYYPATADQGLTGTEPCEP